MLKIALIADIHSNFPALKEIFKSIEDEKCDYVYSLWDAISIWPYPYECIDYLLNNKKVNFINGNHEDYFIKSLTKDNQPEYMSDSEFDHQKWIHSQLNKDIKLELSEKPFFLKQKYYNTDFYFCHSNLCHSNDDFQGFWDLRNKNSKELDEIFWEINSSIIWYWHIHKFSDLEWNNRYINPGSAWCQKWEYTQYSIITVYDNYFEVKHLKVKYDKNKLINAMIDKKVPDRNLICKIFFKVNI